MLHSDESCKIMYGNLFLGAAVLIHCPSALQNARGEAIDRATPTPPTSVLHFLHLFSML